MAERYRIVSLVGRGGMGEVYRADDLKLGQTVALKFLPRDWDRDELRLEHFRNEVRLARSVAHPNVCRVYDIGEADGQVFLSMEFVDGEDLRSLLRRIGRLPKDKGIQIAQQICLGLSAAHQQGVLHRDLKPANIMLDGRGQVRITDFGLARLAADGVFGEIAGTPFYMAPEQRSRGETTVQSDLYSLGLVLYELFTGQHCFKSGTGDEAQPTHRSALKLPSSVVDDIDPAVERAIVRCLEFEPRDRPQSAISIAGLLPGHDALAVAVAAGETPSPDLVAAAGGHEGLQAKLAVICLLGVAVGLVALCFLGDQLKLVNQSPMTRPTKLEAEAEYWLRNDLGLAQAETDYFDCGYTLRPRDSLTPVRFWYRRRSELFYPAELWSIEISYFCNFGRVEPQLPRLEVPEELIVELDGNGRLVGFRKLPPAHFTLAPDEKMPPARNVDCWSKWLPEDRLGFSLDHLIPLEDSQSISELPIPTPPYPFDQIRVWRREAEDDSPTHYVVAASFRDQLTHFETFSVEGSAPHETSFEFMNGLNVVLFVFALFLIYPNWRRGRIDRRGLTHGAVAIFAISMLVWLLSANHVLGTDELGILWFGVATSSFYAARFGLWYCALEPLVRRLWPESLISWTRCIAGRVRDPIVGRDLLIGCLFAVLHLATASLITLTIWWLGSGRIPLQPSQPQALQGVLGEVALITHVIALGFYVSCYLMVLLAFLRRILPNLLVAGFAFAAIQVMAWAVLPGLGNDKPMIDIAIRSLAIGIGWSLYAFVIARFGLLAYFTTWVTAGILHVSPLTANSSHFYFPSSVVACAFVLAVALYGFHTTLGGRPLRQWLQWSSGS